MHLHPASLKCQKQDNHIWEEQKKTKKKNTPAFYLLTSQDKRQRGTAGGPGDKRGITEGLRPHSEGERPLQPLTYRREREREGGRQSVSMYWTFRSICLPAVFTSTCYSSICNCLSLRLSVCLRSTSGSCWLSASCLHGNRIHEPQIAPPSRVSLRHIEPHRTPTHFKNTPQQQIDLTDGTRCLYLLLIDRLCDWCDVKYPKVLV